MFEDKRQMVHHSIAQAIQDAILFGNVKEIHGILDMVEGDEDFPEDLRHKIEALMYFREHYGRGGDLESKNPLIQQRIQQMESAWGRELIEMISYYTDTADSKYA
jgi:hypothetical protein